MANRKQTTTPVASIGQRIALNIILLLVGAAAFRMSFDHHVKIAAAAGIPLELGIFYPLVVDAAILVAMLIGIWIPTLTNGQRRYVWWTVAFFTALSVANNSLSVLVLEPEKVTMPMWAAIAVHAVPAITLFVVVHLAVNTVLNPANRPPRRTLDQQPTATTSARQSASAQDSAPVRALSSAPSAQRPRRGAPVPAEHLATILRLKSEGLGARDIAEHVPYGKSKVSEIIRDHQEANRA